MIDVKKALFDVGQVVSTPGALQLLQRNGLSPWEFLSRHIQGDWGIVSDEDKAANDEAIRDGSRILSAYVVNDVNDGTTKLWVITEAVGDNGKRASSCLLLPDEY